MTKIKVHDPTTGKMIEVEVPVKKCPPSPRDWVQHVQTNWRQDGLTTRKTYLPADLMSSYQY